MFLKSIFIIGYLVFIIGAGFLHLFRSPYAYYTYPWTNYSMFSIGSRFHFEHALYGVYEDESVEKLDLAQFFPMPLLFIQRGRGKGITYDATRSFFNGAEDKSLKLCKYILQKHNDTAGKGRKLVRLVIKLHYYPIIKGGWSQLPTIKRLTASCTPHPQNP